MIVLAGLVLTLLGPILGVITWLIVRRSAPVLERSGLFATSIVRASLVSFFGVLSWWGVLVAIDALRLGLVRI